MFICFKLCDRCIDRIPVLVFFYALHRFAVSNHILEIFRPGIQRVPQKTCDYIFYNNFNNKCPITIIFGIVSGKSMRHRKMVSFPTSPI